MNERKWRPKVTTSTKQESRIFGALIPKFACAAVIFGLACLILSCSHKPRDAGAQPPSVSISVSPSASPPSNVAERIETTNIEPLLANLKHKRAEKRKQAASELGQTGNSRAVEPLIAALRDSDFNVRASAAKALGELGAARAAEPLAAALKDRVVYVHWVAARALGQIGDVRSIDALIAELGDTENSYAAAEAADSLAKIGAPALGPLLTALQNKRQLVRQCAARALGEIADTRAHDPLLAALKERNLELIAGAYRFFLRRGEAGTESVMIEALNRSEPGIYPGYDMATTLLNCGNSQLEEAARKWARRYDYRVVNKPGVGLGVMWGNH